MPTEFGKAFYNARNQGLKQFDYNGKPYTTQYREEKMLTDAINDYPAMQDMYNNQNTVVSLANAQRLQQLKNVGGSDRVMETWFPDDEGEPGLKHPTPGKFNFEFYNADTYNDPAINKAAIFLDALHGMKQDPKYAAMRNEFNQNWKPSELDWIKQKYAKEANEGETLGGYVDRTVIDAYLRGGMNPMDDATLKVASSSGKYNDEYAQLYRGMIKKNGQTVDPYSSTQRALIANMLTYLKTKK
jgi:hypothetical protein